MDERMEERMSADRMRVIENALRNSLRRYPNCTIANCDCDSKHGEWKPGCGCMCHFKDMDQLKGEGKWSLDDLHEMREKGLIKSR